MRGATKMLLGLVVLVVFGGLCARAVDNPPKGFHTPDFIPPTRNGFSDALWSDMPDPIWIPAKPMVIRTSVVEYSVGVQSSAGEQHNTFVTDQNYTYDVSGFTVPVPQVTITKHTINHPSIVHTLSFGPPKPKGPRVELLVSGTGDVSDHSSTKNWLFASNRDGGYQSAGLMYFDTDGQRRRWRLTLSWPLLPKRQDRWIQKMRLRIGWESVEDRFTRSNQHVLRENQISQDNYYPGHFSNDRFVVEGPVVGMSGTWDLSRASEAFVDFGFMYCLVEGGVDRDGLSPDISWEGTGLGWSGKVGMRFHRGRAFLETSISGYSIGQEGGTVTLDVPATGDSFKLNAKETALTSLGAQVRAGWRF